MSVLNAKFRYIELCRSLRTYGVSFFAVKVHVPCTCTYLNQCVNVCSVHVHVYIFRKKPHQPTQDIKQLEHGEAPNTCSSNRSSVHVQLLSMYMNYRCGVSLDVYVSVCLGENSRSQQAAYIVTGS